MFNIGTLKVFFAKKIVQKNGLWTKKFFIFFFDESELAEAVEKKITKAFLFKDHFLKIFLAKKTFQCSILNKQFTPFFFGFNFFFSSNFTVWTKSKKFKNSNRLIFFSLSFLTHISLVFCKSVRWYVYAASVRNMLCVSSFFVFFKKINNFFVQRIEKLLIFCSKN